MYKAVLWGIRDLQFYDGFDGSSTKFDNIVINLSNNEITITIMVGGKKHSVTYSNNHFKHSPEYLDNYILPFEDRDYFSRLLESEKENLAKATLSFFGMFYLLMNFVSQVVMKTHLRVCTTFMILS